MFGYLMFGNESSLFIPKLSDLSASPRGKKHFTYSLRRTDIAIVVFHKLSEAKICGNLQLFSRLSRFVVANRSIWVIIISV